MVLGQIFLGVVLIAGNAWGEIARSTHGEMQTPEFFGSHLSDFKYNPYLFKLSLNEEKFRSNYVEDQINDEFFSLSEFISEELYLGLSCPDDSFLDKHNYIRFLNRLQVMSYLFQSLREHEYTMNRLNVKNTCKVDWVKKLDNCNPKSQDMKLFIKNSKSAFKSLPKLKSPLEKGLKQFQKEWISKIKNKKASSLTGSQLTDFCEENDCSDLSIRNLASYIEPLCQREVSTFESICNESDSFYGLSHVPEAYQLLISSSGLRGINKDGLASGCVKRFILQNKNLEKNMPFLETTFSVLYEYNLEETPQNPQGSLFTMGALREFTEKGLDNVFQMQRKSVKNAEVEKTVEPLPEIKLKEIVLPKFVKKKRVKKKKKKEIVNPKDEAPRKSSFLISCEVREQFDLPVMNIDMEKFKRDYVFTLSEKEKLLPIVQQFSSVKALRSMQKLDKLGSKLAPLPLKFLKFLIDEKMNQNLFNIKLVLGDSFYIKNDIDLEINSPILIELFFDSTDWKIKVLKPI